jgi:hypothetical protein
VVQQALPLLSPRCGLVLTFKNVFGSKAEWACALREGIETLTAFCEADSVQEVHLLANTPNETTIIARVAPAGSARSDEDGSSAAASAAALDEYRTQMTAARRIAHDTCDGVTLFTRPRSKRERAAFAAAHAHVVTAWQRARAIRDSASEV